MANKDKAIKEKMYYVKARSTSPRGFIRCGMRWPYDGDSANLSESQLETLKAEKMIVVISASEITEDKDNSGAEGTGKAGE